jgi:hypothetical protein
MAVMIAGTQFWLWRRLTMKARFSTSMCNDETDALTNAPHAGAASRVGNDSRATPAGARRSDTGHADS